MITSDNIHYGSSFCIPSGTFSGYASRVYGDRIYDNNPSNSVVCEYCGTRYIVAKHEDYKCPYCSAPNRRIR